MPSKRPLRCRYEPEAALLLTEQMRPIEELAYRRIVDLILVSQNRLINDDAELERMTKTAGAWAEIKQRLIKNHKVLYVDDTYLRSAATNDTWEAVERTTRQKSGAGRASAAKRQAKKDTAAHPAPPPPASTTPRPPLPEVPVAAAHQPLAEPMATDRAPEPAPIVLEPVPAPMNGNGADDESTEPKQEGTTIPQDWLPGTEGIAFAINRGFAERQIEPLTREFVARNTAEGIVSKDWNATWRLSVLRAVNSSPPLDASSDHERMT